MQSFRLWQQATIEIIRRAHFIIVSLHHIYMRLVLHAHPVRGESRMQRNANRDVEHLQQGWARLVEMTESERDK